MFQKCVCVRAYETSVPDLRDTVKFAVIVVNLVQIYIFPAKGRVLVNFSDILLKPIPFYGNPCFLKVEKNRIDNSTGVSYGHRAEDCIDPAVRTAPPLDFFIYCSFWSGWALLFFPW